MAPPPTWRTSSSPTPASEGRIFPEGRVTFTRVGYQCDRSTHTPGLTFLHPSSRTEDVVNRCLVVGVCVVHRLVNESMHCARVWMWEEWGREWTVGMLSLRCDSQVYQQTRSLGCSGCRITQNGSWWKEEDESCNTASHLRNFTGYP